LEPITHFLTGACLGRAGFNRKTALATATMCLAAEAPDLDVLANLKGGVFGFAHHRGFTHSFIGLIFPCALVVFLVYGWWNLRGRKIDDPARPPRWGLLFLFAYFAGLSHILLDYTNNYGVRPFWPFSERWFSWDIVFIIEPVLWLVLVAGLVLPSLFALIGEEVGARRERLQGRLGATLALGAVVALWGVRDYEHRRAVAALEARQYENANPVRVMAGPYWVNPFRWSGLVETQDFFATASVTTWDVEVDPNDQMQIWRKPEQTPVTIAAKKSYLGRVYLDWARYPLTETEPLADGGYVVKFKDLRFDYPEMRRRRSVLEATVILDSKLDVRGEKFGK
jgi:inner membrane protein